MKKGTPRIILFDLETSYLTVANFSLRTEYTSHQNILTDWYIICCSWMELGEKKVHSVSLLDDLKRFKKNPSDDFYVVSKIRDVLRDADLLIAHNGDRFDIKKLNARLIYHGINPLPPIATLDTLKEIRKIAAITSNKLDYLGTYLHVGNKIKTDNEMWLKILRGDIKSIKDMVQYNREDVLLLKRVYLKIRKYIKRHPIFAKGDGEFVCPVCDSLHIVKQGLKPTRIGIKQRWQCFDCGSWSLGREYLKITKPFITN